jgi:hypothetical protein
MTYQQKLDHLSKACEQKAEAFIEALKVHEQYSAHVTLVKSEWEAAELAYLHCRNFVRTGKVALDDISLY